MVKTLSQLADEYGVTPKTLRKHIKMKLGFKSIEWYEKDKRKTFYTPKELELIYRELGEVKRR